MSIATDKTILIIDDEEANRYMAGHTLKKAGYRVLEASNWQDGQAHLSPPPKLVILDIQLPDGNGFQICRQIKEQDATRNVPVLLTSAAFTRGIDKAHGLDIGADGYLTTPIDPLELTATVRALLRIKEAEEELREAYVRVESASAAKTSFLANISHEIRTPINVIMGVGEILSRTPLSARQQECVETLRISTQALLELVNDVLDISKIENNSVEIETAPFDLKVLLGNVRRMMAVKAHEKGLELTFDDAALTAARFEGDAARLSQVVINIVNNAIKFTESGSVAVKARDEASADGRRLVTVVVADTGIGIPPDKQQMIFEKFTQGDISTTRKFGGTGLGLTICKALLERMGGAIDVQSNLGTGSEFIIRLPLRAAASLDATREADATKPAERTGQAGSGRVLVVEDYPANLLVTTTFLDDLGYSFDTAMNGNEAIALWRQNKYDVVLMDIQMQGMDGYQTTRLIREEERAGNRGHTTVIAMTAHALSGEAEKCRAAGMDDYLSKPYRLTDLQEKLARYIQA